VAQLSKKHKQADIEAQPTWLGRYRLVEPLGRGGMAELYLARSVDQRVVVIKRVAPALLAAGRRSSGARYADLLVAEAQLTAHMRHPNVVRALGLGQGEDGAPYMVLEWVEGVDLRLLLRLCTKRRIGLPIPHALTIVAALLSGLDHVHRLRDECGLSLNVVHRDISPSNVLLGFDGSVKLCDFGISLSRGMPDVPLDTIEGKAGYMSPEHAHGAALDRRSDLYAVGILLWELLAGRRRYKARAGESLLQVARRASTSPLPLRGLPHEAELHAIVHRALSRDRDARYPSAAEMLRELEAYQRHSGMPSSPASLSRWLVTSLPDVMLGARAARERAMGVPLIDDDPIDVPERSGARRIRRAELSLDDAPPERWRFAAKGSDRTAGATALFACGLSLALLTLLTALGAM
jgi:serine/threonine-protein kinase